jgi:hypothetical protein
MSETTRFYVIVTTMKYLMLVPDMTIDIAYEIADKLYIDTYGKMQKMLAYEILTEH